MKDLPPMGIQTNFPDGCELMLFAVRWHGAASVDLGNTREFDELPKAERLALLRSLVEAAERTAHRLENPQ